ncbi:uncharacterized protein METZ01_LOCUS158316 [marine metagenome]|uniref:Uncharacterized protein n=1 Tax=marine metagenome TaxID=408172 RepID=A0A382AWN3_9ZZZZ
MSKRDFQDIKVNDPYLGVLPSFNKQWMSGFSEVQ